MSETYEQIRLRHDRELREWTERAIAGQPSINAAARRSNINPGTLWRLAQRWPDSPGLRNLGRAVAAGSDTGRGAGS